MEECIFCKIVKKEIPCHQIWEDKEHLAFLSIFPNTEGFSVVIPKKHYPSYAFDLSDEVLTKLIPQRQNLFQITPPIRLNLPSETPNDLDTQQLIRISETKKKNKLLGRIFS